jgi:hypothetical protein
MLADAGDHYTAIGPMPALAIPTTLQASLLARLDQLGDIAARSSDTPCSPANGGDTAWCCSCQDYEVATGSFRIGFSDACQ